MSTFDPDAFLAKHEAAPAPKAAFDPDAFLAKNAKFSGKPEVEAEKRKLLDEMGPGGRLLAGIGHGMYNTHLNISDTLGHLPGLSRVDPESWKEQEEVAAPLTQDAVGGFGDLTGQSAPLALTGFGAEALAAEMVPEALAAARPLLALGSGGAAQGTIAAGPENRTAGAVTGFLAGPLLKLVGGAASRVPGALKRLGIGVGSKLLPGAPEEAVVNALEGGVIKPWATQEAIAQRAASARAEAGRDVGNVVRGAEALGAQGPEVQPLIDDLRATAQRVEPSVMNPSIPNAYRRAADRLALKATPEPGPQPGRGRLSLSQMEALKQDLQDTVKYGRPEPKGLERARADIASRARAATERALNDAAAVNPEIAPLAAKFGPAKEKAGAAIEVAKAAKKAAKPGLLGKLMDAGSLMSAAAGGYAHAGPKGALLALPVAGAEHVLRTRGPSTLAAGSYGLGRALSGAVGPLAGVSPVAARAAAPVLAQDEDVLQRAIGQILRGESYAP